MTDPTQGEALVEYVRRALELEDPAEMERRAGELTSLGYGRTAAHVRERAARLRAAGETRSAGEPAGAAGEYESPIPEASASQWTRFVRLMQVGAPGDVTPSGQVGLFGTRFKRLEDLGLVREVRRQARDRKVEWAGRWTTSLSLDQFLSNPLLQYRAFAASMKRYRAEILERHGAALGQEIEGRRATLSGLLAVAHHAGPALASWIANAADRRRFGKTTAAYSRTTGVF